jgi:competence protein ComGC
MKQPKGLTLIQLMIILLVLGIVGSLIVDAIIDKRCEANPRIELCTERAAAK